jgi:hypothetical protein
VTQWKDITAARLMAARCSGRQGRRADRGASRTQRCDCRDRKRLSLGGRIGLEAAGGAVPAALRTVVAPARETAAAKHVMQALGPAKERFKAMAERLTPEILRRGLRGSREAVQARAADMAHETGSKIDDAIQQYGARQVDHAGARRVRAGQGHLSNDRPARSESSARSIVVRSGEPIAS